MVCFGKGCCHLIWNGQNGPINRLIIPINHYWPLYGWSLPHSLAKYFSNSTNCFRLLNLLLASFIILQFQEVWFCKGQFWLIGAFSSNLSLFLQQSDKKVWNVECEISRSCEGTGMYTYGKSKWYCCDLFWKGFGKALCLHNENEICNWELGHKVASLTFCRCIPNCLL